MKRGVIRFVLYSENSIFSRRITIKSVPGNYNTIISPVYIEIVNIFFSDTNPV